MAFNIEAHKSTRLNRLNAGQVVTLCDFTKKRAIMTAKVVGWFLKGNAIAAPSSMKFMEEGTALRFADAVDLEGNAVAETLDLVQAPNTYGALFLASVTGEGETAKTTYRRITAYETVADAETRAKAIAESKAAKEAEKAAKAAKAEAEAAQVATETPEAATVEETAETVTEA